MDNYNSHTHMIDRMYVYVYECVCVCVNMLVLM